MYRKFWSNSIISYTTGMISAIYCFVVDTKIPKKSNWLDRISTEYICKSLDYINDREK